MEKNTARIQQNVFTLTLDGVIYRVNENVYANGKSDYWVKVGPWISDLHDSKGKLILELKRSSPLSQYSNNKPSIWSKTKS